MEYESEQVKYKSIGLDSVSNSDDDEQALIEQTAAKSRQSIDNEDIRNGGSIHSSATVCGNLVIFGSADKHIYALDRQTGGLVWKFLTGDAIASTAYVENGLVYFGSYDTYFYALNVRDGGLVWKFKTNDIVFGSPIVLDNVVYIGGADSWVYALKADTGDVVWKFKANEMILTSPRIVNETLLVGSDDYYVYALDRRTGDLKWKFRTTGPPTNPAAMTVSGKLLVDFIRRKPAKTSERALACFATWGSNHLFVLDIETGRLLSQERVGVEHMWGFTINDGIAYSGVLDPVFYAVDVTSGRIVWRFHMGGMSSSCACVRDGVVYFGSYDQNIYAVDTADGRPLWKFRVDGLISSSPIIDGNVLYFGSWDTYFYAFDIEQRKVLWKFKTNAPPCKPSFIESLSAFKQLKRAVVRWWKPEQPRLKIYDTKIGISSGTSSSPYKSEIGYKSEAGYKSNAPAGYEMNRERKKDMRDPWRR